MVSARKRIEVAEEFGARVRARRTKLGWSQRVLAESAGMDWSYVSQVERGERNIALMNIVRIAKALQINPAELVRDLAP
jgi:transcriptional regulator with XRE-family HTH domain